MSYCVNCGVELSDTEKVCPLCGTEVINPRSPWVAPECGFYSDKRDEAPAAISKKYMAAIISVLLMIPILATLACDLVSSGGITWSLYVLGGILLLMVWFLLPLFFKRFYIALFLPLDAVCTALYLFLIETMVNGDWFLTLALPICVLTCSFLLLWITLFKNRKETTLLVRIALALFSLGVFIVLIELILNAHYKDALMLIWSQYVLIPCASLTLVLLLIDSNKNFKEAIRRRIFIK